MQITLSTYHPAAYGEEGYWSEDIDATFTGCVDHYKLSIADMVRQFGTNCAGDLINVQFRIEGERFKEAQVYATKGEPELEAMAKTIENWR